MLFVPVVTNAWLILTQVAASLEKDLLPRLSRSPPDIEALRLYLTLPECPLLSNPSNYTTLTIPFSKAVVNLKDAPIKVLGTSRLLWEEFCLLGFIPALSAYSQGIRDVADFVSSAEHKRRFLTQTVAVYQSYNGSQWDSWLWERKKHTPTKPN